MTELETETSPQEQTSVDKSETKIRRMFGDISPRYDFLNHFLSGGVDYYWRWQTVRRVKPTCETPILDVCTGTGDLALAYWKKGAGQLQIVATDFTHEMLQLANEKAEKKKINRSAEDASLTFLEADTQRLPFESDQFQIVSVAFGLRNVTDTRAGLREMTRVCQSGGRVAILEFSMPENRLLRGLYSWYFRHILPRIGQLLTRNKDSAYSYLPQSVSEFPQGEGLAVLMRESGLESVEWWPLTFGIATLYCGIKPTSTG